MGPRLTLPVLVHFSPSRAFLFPLARDPKELADQCYQTGGVCVIAPWSKLKQKLGWPRQVGKDGSKRPPEPADVIRKLVTEIGQVRAVAWGEKPPWQGALTLESRLHRLIAVPAPRHSSRVLCRRSLPSKACLPIPTRRTPSDPVSTRLTHSPHPLYSCSYSAPEMCIVCASLDAGYALSPLPRSAPDRRGGACIRRVPPISADLLMPSGGKNTASSPRVVPVAQYRYLGRRAPPFRFPKELACPPYHTTLPIIILSTIYDSSLLPQNRPENAVALFGKQ